MEEQIQVRCLMCGKGYVIGNENKDYKKLTDPTKPAAFICELCSNKVRYESDEMKKPKKPM